MFIPADDVMMSPVRKSLNELKAHTEKRNVQEKKIQLHLIQQETCLYASGVLRIKLLNLSLVIKDLQHWTETETGSSEGTLTAVNMYIC